jgi:hypothetical protein
MPLNKQLLRKVRNRIAKIPESYYQGAWIESSKKSPCGTTACLAGETIIVSSPSIKRGIDNLQRAVSRYAESLRSDVGVVRKARLLLGINLTDAEAMFGLRAAGWPKPFADRFTRAKTNRQRAKIAVAYLDECLKRGAVTW